MYFVKCWVDIFSGLFGLFALAQQCMKEQGISCMVLSVGFIYLAACLARQWMKEQRISCMHVKCWVHIFRGSFGSAVDERMRNKC